MFLKNSARRLGNSVRSTPAFFARWSAHSLRLRLMFWYSGLLLLGLSCFALLVLFLAFNSINDNVKNAIKAETRVATLNLNRSLESQPPYWPGHLALDTLDTYNTPGITIEVFDLQGTKLYTSNQHSSPGLDNTTIQQVLQSDTPIWYNTNVDGDQVIVEASAIYPPGQVHITAAPPPRAVQRLEPRPVTIGVLLVSKSLQDANATLAALQGLLLLTGVLILILFLACGWLVVGYALRPLSD